MSNHIKAVGRFLLGMFVLWQVFFLLTHNLLTGLNEARTELPDWAKNAVEPIDPQWAHGKGDLYDSMQTMLDVTDTYADLTAQPQGWSLFAPNPSSDITFVALELSWNDDAYKEILPTYFGPLIAAANSGQLLAAANVVSVHPPIMRTATEWIYSKNEPVNRKSFLRLGNFRLRRYEGQIDLIFRIYQNETLPEAEQRWRELIDKELRTDWDAIRAYMKWQLANHQRTKKTQTIPKQVILQVRRYHIPSPDVQENWDWSGPYAMPIARWFPQQKTPPGVLPIQMYDPVDRRFVWLKW